MDKRRVVVVSEDLAEPWDEGIKKFTWSLSKAIARTADVRMLNVDRSGVGGEEAVRIPSSKTFLKRELWQEVRYFDPDAVLYVPSPSSTIASFFRAAVLRRAAPRAFVGMIALIPRQHGALAKPLLKHMAPDLVWVPSYRSLLYLSGVSVRGETLPVGVDTTVLAPPAAGEREELRHRHGIGERTFVCLHVGHLSPHRNVRALASLRDVAGVEVIVIGSTSTPEGSAVRRGLDANGVRVIREYVDVSEYYKLADCYVFPVKSSDGSIEMPLSVLEALSSGLPVLTTPFGGLRDFLAAGDDLRYWESEQELVAAVTSLRDVPPPAVRDMSDFDWRRIAERVMGALEKR